jgi:hypothetical protein
MTLATIRTRRKEAALTEVHVEAEFSHRRHELSVELDLVVADDESIECSEILFDVRINSRKDASLVVA